MNMTTFLTIRGDIPVGPVTPDELTVLREWLESDGDEAAISDGVLTIDINTTVPHSFVAKAIEAIDAFCTVHATAGAVFDHNDGDNDGDLLFFGPTPAMKREAHLAYLERALDEASIALDRARDRASSAYNTPYHPRPE